MKVVCVKLYRNGDNPNFSYYYNKKYLTIGKSYDVFDSKSYSSAGAIKCDDGSWLGVVDEYFMSLDDYRLQKLERIL